MTAGGPPGTIYCLHCGQPTAVRWNEDQSRLLPCPSCGGVVVGMRTLLADLGLWSTDVRECPRCAHVNLAHRFCHFCGWDFG